MSNIFLFILFLALTLINHRIATLDVYSYYVYLGPRQIHPYTMPRPDDRSHGNPHPQWATIPADPFGNIPDLQQEHQENNGMLC